MTEPITSTERDAAAEVDRLIAAGHKPRNVAVQMGLQVLLIAEHRDALLGGDNGSLKRPTEQATSGSSGDPA